MERRDSSVGRASGLGPRGPGSESACGSSESDIWAVTLVVASPYQGVNLGPGPGMGIQSWLWGSLHASKSRAQAMKGSPWLWNPWAQSTKVQNRECQWLHKMVTANLKKESRGNVCNWVRIEITVDASLDWLAGEFSLRRWTASLLQVKLSCVVLKWETPRTPFNIYYTTDVPKIQSFAIIHMTAIHCDVELVVLCMTYVHCTMYVLFILFR